MSSMKFVIEDTAWAESLEREFEDYLGECYNQVDEFLEDGQESAFETESGTPYCGCSDCHTREIMVFLTPRIIQAYKDGKVSLA